MRFLRDALITLALLIVIVCLVASIPADAKRQTNPFRPNATMSREAADHYGDHCAACHGNDGHGKTSMGENLYPRTPDLAGASVQHLSDGELFYIIQNGVRWTGMPAWKHEHSAEDSWRLVSFIRAVPTLTYDDLRSVGLGASEEDEHQHHEHGSPVGQTK